MRSDRRLLGTPLGIGNFTIGLFHVTGSPGVYIATGTSLASATFSNSILSGTGQAFYTFNNLNWNLSPNTVYMFGIGETNPDTVKWTLNQSVTKDNSAGGGDHPPRQSVPLGAATAQGRRLGRPGPLAVSAGWETTPNTGIVVVPEPTRMR